MVCTPRLELWFIWWPKHAGILVVCKGSACTMEYIFVSEWDIEGLEGVQGEKAWPKDVTIMTMKAIPEFNVTIPFCQVARVNKGFNIVLKVLIVLKHIIFAIHLHSGRVINKIM